MARYDYRCPHCHHVFEVEHGMDEKPLVVCPVCGQEAQRVFEASGISLKGSGFYNTDSRDKPAKSTASATKSTAESSKTTADGASSSEASGSASPSKESSAKPSSESGGTSSSATQDT